ncbi:DoxX-like protein [Stackebrandtia albiflava]|uniref:DoxX-like protein n=1 Tax=Stackebrandtia albiflava TaxID=406432 RepID=A0A562VB05_9ACTN|nr:DoxX family protein [Stackebrandtia albiflava]TWJ15044.1 DoxX-like protein [Stackebrandtia albiflava]
MDIVIWSVTAVLALGFLASGTVKLVSSPQRLVAAGYRWAADFPPASIKCIGLAETAGAVGLVLPAVIDIRHLGAVAAAGLAVLMAGAVVTHLRRGERAQAAVPAVLAVLTAVVAALRFGPFPQ